MKIESMLLVLMITTPWIMSFHSQVVFAGDGTKVESFEQPPERAAFFKTIQESMKQDSSPSNECAIAIKGMKLAIKLTRDPAARKFERTLKRGYILEDFASWASNFFIKSCNASVMKPLVAELVQAEESAYKAVDSSYTADEPGLSFLYLAAANFYATRCNDNALAERTYDLAMKNIPEVRYNKTHSIIPEKFAVALADYEQMLKRIAPLKAEKIKKVTILRVQQKAKWLNNVGNKYLDGVFEPVYKTGLREYEVKKAIEVFTQAIDLIPTWSEPYKGRAKAYELLGKFDLSKKDSKKAKQLEG